MFAFMLTTVNPKLPMRDKAATKDFYLNKLGFSDAGNADYEGYLMIKKDDVEIHFFEFRELDPKESYGQVYIRTNDIEPLRLIQKQSKDQSGRTSANQTVGAKRICHIRSRQ